MNEWSCDQYSDSIMYQVLLIEKKKRFLISREIHLQPWSDMLVIILFEREDQHSRWWHFRLARNQWICFKPASQSKSELQIDSSSQAKSCNYVWYNGDMLKLVTVREVISSSGSGQRTLETQGCNIYEP
jgi:hypothetical protein